MDVSIIIVNYNTCALTLQCLQSIYKEVCGISFEVIVVDNASKDDSVVQIREKYPAVILIENEENQGFGRANNLGVKYAKGTYLFFLNSDTIVISNIVRQFFDYMEKHREYASCGGNLLDCKGVNTASHGRFPSILQEFSDIGFVWFYRQKYRQNLSVGQIVSEGVTTETDYISGADMFIRKDIFDSMEGFDSNIFMYYEETDLYYRMQKAGFKSCVLPYVCLIHLVGGSFEKAKESKRFNMNRYKMFLASKAYFWRKNYGSKPYLLVKFFMMISILMRGYKYKKDWFRVMYAIVKS
ncbi:glycosyltransferase family 2 protein [Bacteroidales bacterium SW292]|nr:glycosyltransferase family 2 protein [Bacteroidales bacterium SW292]